MIRMYGILLAISSLTFVMAGITIVHDFGPSRDYVAHDRQEFKPVLAAVTAEALSSKTYSYVDWVTSPDPRFEKCMHDVVTYMNVAELRLVLYTGCPVLKN